MVSVIHGLSHSWARPSMGSSRIRRAAHSVIKGALPQMAESHDRLERGLWWQPRLGSALRLSLYAIRT